MEEKILNNKGFTFLEFAVTLFVILFGILAVFKFAQYPVTYTALSNSRLTAIYLAQEGIEIVRNIRDENWINSVGWDDDLGAGDWEADYRTNLRNYTGNPLKYDAVDNYNLDVGNDTNFTRRINITKFAGPPEYLRIRVYIEWDYKSEAQTAIILQENLYDWWLY